MKWNKTHYPAGSLRRKTGFLFFPKSLPTQEGKWETRWLEKATWEEEKVFDRIDSWVAERWVS